MRSTIPWWQDKTREQREQVLQEQQISFPYCTREEIWSLLQGRPLPIDALSLDPGLEKELADRFSYPLCLPLDADE